MLKRKYKGPSERRIPSLIAKLIDNAPTSALRPGIYLRGFSLVNNPDVLPIGSLRCMGMGGILQPFKRSNKFATVDKSNIMAMVVQDHIAYGNYMEAFTHKDGNAGTSVPIPDRARVSFTMDCIVIPAMMFVEMQNGFAPYVFINYKNEAGDLCFVRVQTPPMNQNANFWLKETFGRYKHLIY